MMKWIQKNLILAFCLLVFGGCGYLGGESSQEEKNAQKTNAEETKESTSEEEGWTPETTLPDPD